MLWEAKFMLLDGKYVYNLCTVLEVYYNLNCVTDSVATAI